MLTRKEMIEMLGKVETKEERMKIIFENLTYEEAKNNPNVLCCVADYDENFDKANCDKYIICRSCKKAFIERYKKHFKKEKKGNIKW